MSLEKNLVNFLVTWPLDKFQHNIKISITMAHVSRLSICYDYGYTKKYTQSGNCTLFSPAPNDVTYCILLLMVITEPDFKSVPGIEIKTCGGACPISSSNHLWSTHSWLR